MVTATNTSSVNTLDGFTIQNGTNGVKASSVLPIYNCKIRSNTTGIRMTAFTIISGNEVSYNTSHGIYLNSRSGGNVLENKIHHNTRRGIYCDQSKDYVINRNSIEYNNTGCAYMGGGIFCEGFDSGTSYIANNFIRGNGANSGGGIYCFASNLNIYNNTIVNNNCTINGGGICIKNFSNNTLYICNNIVANNTGHGMYIDNNQWNYIYTVYLTKNCTYQNSSGDRGISGSGATFGGTVNEIYANPGLSGDNCHLATGSNCINAGWTFDWNGSRYYGLYDIDGNARINNSYLDVGCDEVQ